MKYVRQHARYLDRDLSVGSSIRYRFSVEQSRYVPYNSKKKKKITGRSASLELSLTDCNKTITWGDQYGDHQFKHMRNKLTAAIKVLTRAVNDLDDLEEKYDAIKVTEKDSA